MDIVIIQLNIISLITIALIIGLLILTYLQKKWMVTYGLIVTNFIVFVITLVFPSVLQQLGFRPVFLSAMYFPQIYTLFTSMFIHADFLHILGNMLIFFLLGVPFEQRIGRKLFFIIFIVSGIIGTLTYSLLNLDSTIPLVGASGAIFGIMGAFAYAYPNDKVIVPIPLVFIAIFRRVRVIIAVIIFIAVEIAIELYTSVSGQEDYIAHYAHFGGLIGGVILAAILLRHHRKKRIEEEAPSDFNTLEPPKKETFHYQKLSDLAITPELQDILARITNETVPQVRDVWFEYFIEQARCPKCSSPLKHDFHKIKCTKCDYEKIY